MRIFVALAVLLLFSSLLCEDVLGADSRRPNRRTSRVWFRNRKRLVPSKIKQIKHEKEKFVSIDKPLVKVKGPSLKEEKSAEMKKNEYYIDPALLEKMNKVHSMQDFVKIFKPPGYTIRKEVVGNKDLVWPSKTGISILGRKPDKEKSKDKPKVKEVVYFRSNRVSEAMSDSPAPRCGLMDRVRAIKIKGAIPLYPKCVNVKRCAGCCDVSRKCVPTSTRKVSRNVLAAFGNTGFRQTAVTFTDHSACKCNCIVKPSDCYPKQTYSSSHCQCECKVRDDAKSCPTGKHWSNGECDCICSNRAVCTSLLRQWDEKKCRCSCITTPCPTGQVRHQESCRCIDSAGSDSAFRSVQQKKKENQKSNPWGELTSIDSVFSDGFETTEDEGEDF